jgi:hypothetical protein
MAIKKLPGKMGHMIIILNHIERQGTSQVCCLSKEEEEEKLLTHRYHKHYYNGFMPYSLITA